MRMLTTEEAYDVIRMVKDGIPSFYVENVVIPNLTQTKRRWNVGE